MPDEKKKAAEEYQRRYDKTIKKFREEEGTIDFILDTTHKDSNWLHSMRRKKRKL